MDIDITTVYSSGFDEWYQLYRNNRGGWPSWGVTRLVVVGGRFLDPPCEDPPVFEGPLRLRSEPDNAADPDAILVSYGGMDVGYLVRERTHMVRDTGWNQRPDWMSGPKLVSSEAGLYAVERSIPASDGN